MRGRKAEETWQPARRSAANYRAANCLGRRAAGGTRLANVLIACPHEVAQVGGWEEFRGKIESMRRFTERGIQGAQRQEFLARAVRGALCSHLCFYRVTLYQIRSSRDDLFHVLEGSGGVPQPVVVLCKVQSDPDLQT